MKVCLLFDSTRAVIRAEAILRERGVEFRVVPVPKELTADCGMAIDLDPGSAGAAGEALAAAGIDHRLHRFEPAFDLLTTVAEGGCSAKLPVDLLKRLTAALPRSADPALLVGLHAGDDAGVYRLADDLLLVETVDFFPPVCSDAYEFGRIAAANALSDVYAMGARPVTAMNLVMFPAAGAPLSALGEILRGGADACREAGAALVGGHTVADPVPKYGLAVTGVARPEELVTNAAARPGDRLVLTKPLGGGVLVAGRRAGLAAVNDHRAALAAMKRLNRSAADCARRAGVRAGTDVTGFGLLGHALNVARESAVTLAFRAGALPLHPGARELAEAGCLPGAAFRNLAHLEPSLAVAEGVPPALKMLAVSPETSGGLLLCAAPEAADALVADLVAGGDHAAAVVGECRVNDGIPLRLER